MVATLALFAALGLGTAFAATKLGKDAVKTRNIANSAVKASKLASNAVTEAKIAGAAVTSGKIADGAVTGAKAGNGVLRDMIIVTDREPDSGETDTASKQAFPNCPSGYQMTGGGGRIIGDGGAKDVIFTINHPIVDDGPGKRQWFLQAEALGGVAPGDDWALEGTGVCVKAGT
ncbi:MAG: hypothetical protein FJW90_01550 [Actinobacteria bacterium]|nr:hypothetical protein [Actinomycetota bacterium]